MLKRKTLITTLLDEQFKQKMEALFQWYEREKRKEQKLKVIKF